MSLSGRAAVLGSVLPGIAAGAAFGLVHGWIVAQLALVAVLWVMDTHGTSAVRAAGLAATFSFSLFATGFFGFVVGAPAGLQVWTLVPWLGWSAAFALGAAVAAALASRLSARRAVRWGVLWPLAWMTMEWLASLGSNAMPWLQLGQQQAPAGLLAGWLPMGGALLAGLSMWLLAACVLMALRDTAQRRWWCALAGVLVLGGWVAGRVEWTDASTTVHVALVQPGDKTAAESNGAAASELLRYYRDAAVNTDALLVVTPQLALPKTVDAVPAHYWDEIDATLTRRGADLLMGAYVAADRHDLHNAAVSLGASGRQHYLKHQLFPFGETLPVSGAARRWLDRAMSRPIRDTLRGPAPTSPLRLGRVAVSLSICFESAFAPVWREAAATAALLVNMSSDSALSSRQIALQARQHLQARALEFAKPVVRTSDVDGTYAIDHRGHLVNALAPGMRGVLETTVQTRTGLTPFARFGNAMPALAALVLLAAAVPRPRVQPTVARRPARGQAGQVMLPAVALLTISGGLLYLMVNSNQAVNEKTRVTNAADAAAYSAGIVEARALNFYAYTNRAMVANQMVIAQAISAGSWMRYFGRGAANITGEATDIAIMFGPGTSRDEFEALRLGATFAAAEYAMRYYTSYSPMDVADWALHDYGVIAGIVTLHDGVTQLLSANQLAVQANLVAGLRQRSLANDLVREMDPALEAEVVLASHGFDNFTRRYGRGDDGGDGRGRFADVAMRSRDEFTRQRNWTLSSRDIPLVRRDGELRRRGGTDLVGFDEWRAVDTLELHGSTFGCGRFGLSWCDDIRRPIAWAGVNVNDGGGDEGAGYHGNAYRANSRTGDRVDEDMEVPTFYRSSDAHFSGLPESQELYNLAADADRTSGITVMVTKRHADTLTSGGAARARPSGQLALFNDRPAGARMIALSRAQVFFDRMEPRPAARAEDRREEIGSLYNPYWRVRLVAPTAADRAWAAARQGGLFLP